MGYITGSVANLSREGQGPPGPPMLLSPSKGESNTHVLQAGGSLAPSER